MVSVGKVRLVSVLYDGSESSFEPRIREAIVEYPTATSVLDGRDHPTTGALGDLADRGILDEEYATKSYICPSCDGTDLKYIGACPRCGTTHTIGRTVVRHTGCTQSGPPDEFERSDRGRYCPSCEVSVDDSDLEYDRKNVCRECETEFADFDDRMQCRDCLNTYSPVRVPERTLYEYTLTDRGREWYETQTGARELLVKRLESRGFETEVDATVANADDEHPVHVYAEDSLLDTRLVADVHDEPSPSDVEELRTAAKHADATGLLIVTTPSVSAEIARLTEERGQNLLVLGSDGTLTREWTTVEAAATPSSPP